MARCHPIYIVIDVCCHVPSRNCPMQFVGLFGSLPIMFQFPLRNFLCDVYSDRIIRVSKRTRIISRDNVKVLARVVEARGADALVSIKIDDERVAQVLQHASELVLVVRRGREHHRVLEAGVHVEQAQEYAQQHRAIRGGSGELELVCFCRLGVLKHHLLNAGDGLVHEAAHQLAVHIIKGAFEQVAWIAALGDVHRHEF